MNIVLMFFLTLCHRFVDTSVCIHKWKVSLQPEILNMIDMNVFSECGIGASSQSWTKQLGSKPMKYVHSLGDNSIFLHFFQLNLEPVLSSYLWLSLSSF